MDANRPKDGGPAFPVFAEFNGEVIPGMSLRQWYAGQALAGFMASNATDGMPFEFVSANCFKAADAMISFEEKGGK